MRDPLLSDDRVSDEDIVDVEHENIDKRMALTPLASPDAHGRKREGLTEAASTCLSKSERLAAEFNHATVGAEHLVLAMTLVPSANKQFGARHADPDRAFQAAMLALLDLERVISTPDQAPTFSYSVEMKNILIDASEMARNRDNQDISIDDLLTAIFKLTSGAGGLIRGQRQKTLADQVAEIMKDFERSFDLRFAELSKLLQPAQEQPTSKPRGWIDTMFGR